MTDVAAHEDLDVVRGYFDRWDAYARAVSCNYMHHIEAMAAFRARLVERGPIGSLLDLGCGDAAPIPGLVEGLGMTSYTGMDVTPTALDRARGNLAAIDAPVHLVQADFTTGLAGSDDPFDTILVSLAMHHLPHDDKPSFFQDARARLGDGGVLLAYEPSNRPAEDRDGYVGRQADFFSSQFTLMSGDQVDLLNQHVADADYPESPGEYARMAIDAGFTRARLCYVDPQHFWAALAFTA